MPAEFDPEECRPDDLELERLWDHDPEFQRLRVEWCKAERAFRQAANSEIPPREYAPIVERYKTACQAHDEYLKKKGLSLFLVAPVLGGTMKITIDEEGNVEPGGAAHILAIVNETTNVTEGSPMSEKVAWRTFQCSYCNHAFEARAGRVTTHECEST